MSQQSLSDAEARLRLIDSALADAQDVQERLLNSNSEGRSLVFLSRNCFSLFHFIYVSDTCAGRHPWIHPSQLRPTTPFDRLFKVNEIAYHGS